MRSSPPRGCIATCCSASSRAPQSPSGPARAVGGGLGVVLVPLPIGERDEAEQDHPPRDVVDSAFQPPRAATASATNGRREARQAGRSTAKVAQVSSLLIWSYW
jgi:hypothetical protein